MVKIHHEYPDGEYKPVSRRALLVGGVAFLGLFSAGKEAFDALLLHSPEINLGNINPVDLAPEDTSSR